MSTPSVHQTKIYDFIETDTRNAVVSAVAGSGKTTTLIKAVEKIPLNKTVLLLAFSRDIKKELASRVPASATNVTVSTVHSFGKQSLTGYPEVFTGKYGKLLRDIVSFFREQAPAYLNPYGFSKEDYKLVMDFEDRIDYSQEQPKDKVDTTSNEYLGRVTKLCDLGRLNLIDLENKDNGLAQLDEIATKHNVTLMNGECLRAWCLIKLGISYRQKIDYTDMVFYPNYFNIPTRTYDYVFIDECQDLNACQRMLMQKAIKPKTGRFIGVGDEKQAIFGFAGADSDSFKKLVDIPNTIELPLSVCYRCGKNIIALAQTIVPQIQAHENAIDGVVDYEAKIEHIKDNDMVLCRNTYPLVRLCLQFLAEGKKAKIMGGEIGLSLIKMIEDTQRKREEWTFENMFVRLYGELDKLCRNIMQKDGVTESDAKESGKYSTAAEKVEVLEMLANGLQTPADLVAKIQTIFDDKKGGIVLSTIHKSKGLESDRVFIIHPEKMPSKFAEKEWELTQEENLRYVAYTRAKSHLGIIDVKEFDAWGESKSESRAEVSKGLPRPTDSKWQGEVGEKLPLKLTVILIKDISSSYGDTKLVEMVDENGNLFSKFGKMNEKYIISDHEEVVEGTQVEFQGTIKEHKEYRGEKITVLSRVSNL